MNWIKLRLYFKLFLVFVVTPASIFFSIFALDQNGFFNIEKIEMTVTTKADQVHFAKPYVDQLNTDLAEFKGQSLWRFSLNKIAQHLREQNWIKDFRISRSWPSKIVIEIEPQVLTLLYVEPAKLAQGIVRPVTTDGDLLAEVPTSQAPSLAMLKGEVFLKDKVKRKKAIDLVKSLPADGKMSHKLISEVGYDQKEGYWVEVVQSNMKIKLGDDQFAVKSARVSQVLDYLEKRDLKARVIDANLSKKVLVRLQQNP